MDNEFQKMAMIEKCKNDPDTELTIKIALRSDIHPDIKLYTVRHKNNKKFVDTLHKNLSYGEEGAAHQTLIGAFMMEHVLNIEGISQLGKNTYLNTFQNTLLPEFMSSRFDKSKEFIEGKQKAYKRADIARVISSVSGKAAIAALAAEIISDIGGASGGGQSIDDITPSPSDYDSSLDISTPDDINYVDPSAGVGHVNFAAQTLTQDQAETLTGTLIENRGWMESHQKEIGIFLEKNSSRFVKRLFGSFVTNTLLYEKKYNFKKPSMNEGWRLFVKSVYDSLSATALNVAYDWESGTLCDDLKPIPPRTIIKDSKLSDDQKQTLKKIFGKDFGVDDGFFINSFQDPKELVKYMEECKKSGVEDFFMIAGTSADFPSQAIV